MAAQTPLYERHTALGGKMTRFAGYELPVQYPSGVLAEHRAVRGCAGLFDVSHMGELVLSGPGALPTLQALMTNDYSALKPGRARYGLMLNEDGGTIDDLIVYCLDSDEYMVVVNASNREKDVEWIATGLASGAQMQDISDSTALLALQGPMAEAILSQISDGKLPQKRFSFIKGIIAHEHCLVARTGYTGEDGFELYLSSSAAPGVWDAILAAGRPRGILPCGLGARDTLRLEAAMPLYGHELTESISPLEAGLDFAVKLGKDGFVGQDALLSAPPQRKRVGLRITGRGIAREGCAVYENGAMIGHVTSGTHSPTLNAPIAMALVTAGSCADGAELTIDIRGRMIPAEITGLPFYTAQ